jgi:hypothetical protein
MPGHQGYIYASVQELTRCLGSPVRICGEGGIYTFAAQCNGIDIRVEDTGRIGRITTPSTSKRGQLLKWHVMGDDNALECLKDCLKVCID